MKRLTSHLLFATSLAAAVALAACANPFGPACTLELGWELSPRSRTLVIGETLTPRGTIVTCGGRDRTPASLTLTSDDSSVVSASVDGKSVTAIGVGTSQVMAADARYGPLGSITITVR